MVTWLKEAIGPGRNVYGQASMETLDSVKEKAGQTHIVGAPLVFTAGVAAQCATDPATVDGFARQKGRNLAADDTFNKLQYLPNFVGRRVSASLKEAKSTAYNGLAVGLIKEGTDWVFSTTAVNKKFQITKTDDRAAAADTYTRVEARYVG